MIVEKNIKINNRDFIKHYSDKNVRIKKIGTDEIYDEAIDLPEMNYEYEETNEVIEIV